MSTTWHRNRIPVTSQPKDLNRNPRCELSGSSHLSRLPNAHLSVAARNGDYDP